ncbi:MAG: alpha-amylase, partial [Muribaculaceae bacterium]|nr:alpha-amylase [Muribaculaceae bacterium]
PFCHKAAGWPAYYGGVILQGFYWDSYDDTGWNKFMEQADDLTDAFDLIWIPNSGRIDDFGTARAMGYTPVYWFDHNTIFGSENELRTMIRTFHERGTGFIMDCVLNHKNGAADWVTFANEKVTGPYSGRTFQVMWDNEKYSQICQDDECNYNGYKTTGAKDTGENFDGARDLDHTNATTQHNVKVYQDFLLNELGYAGWRLDETKGFSPYYAGLYNYASKPMFSVGEYWDGNSDVLRWWLESTKINDQIQSATFDFCLKYRINEACNNGSWGALNDKGLAADANYSRWAVTFLDNHDTGRDGYQKVSANVGAANAIILALPGTPCIYYPHWKNYKTQILNCIKGRRAAGVNNMSSITKQEESNGGYIIEVQGTKGKVYLQLGPATGNGTPSGFQLVQSGTNYRFYVSSGLNWKNAPKNSFLPADPNPTEFPASDKVTILVKADDPISGRIYAWDNNDKPIGNPWPGTVLATLPHTMVGGAKWYYKVFDQSTVNVILNNSYDGTGNQTADIKGLKGTVFLNYPTNNSKYENVTTKYTPYIGYEIPEIATKVEGKVYAYLETNDYSAPCAYAWGILDQKFSGKWPGTKMTQVGTAPNGKKVFLWTGDDLTAENMPSNIIFNDG